MTFHHPADTREAREAREDCPVAAPESAPGADDRCAACHVPLSEALERDGSHGGCAHWETAHSSVPVAFTCSDKCTAEVEATRCTACTRLPDPADPQSCACTTKPDDHDDSSSSSNGDDGDGGDGTPVEGPLTATEVLHLSVLIEAANAGRTIRRLASSGEVLTGVCRHVVADLRGGFPGPGDDIRNCYLRVTGTILDHFWPLRELIAELPAGAVAIANEPASTPETTSR